MASFEECLQTAFDGKEISRIDRDRLLKEYGRARARTRYDGGAAAKEQLLKQLAAETSHKKRQARLMIAAVTRISENLHGFRMPNGKPDVGKAALYLLEHYGEAPFDSVAGRDKAIAGQAMARMGQAIEQFRRGRVGGDKARMNRAQLPNVVRELFGEETGDAAAKAYAGAITDTMEWLRLKFNAAGGAIGKLEKWGMPQRHDAKALRNAGLDTWRKQIRPMLDPSRMQHPLSGLPVTDDELDEVLEDVWKSIVTDGMDDLAPSKSPIGRGALANQRAEHRFLVFKNADLWLQYQQTFGGPDPFATLMEHLRFMSRDIAAMEILGPNPNGTIEWMKQTIARDGADRVVRNPKGKADEKAGRAAHRLDEVWGTMRGNFGVPVSATMARVGGGIRNWITASVLGGAALSSVSDAGTSFIARKFAGIGGSVFRDYITALTPAGRQDAVDAGLILDASLNAMHQEARYMGAFDGSGLTGFLADRVISLSGLQAFTQGGRHAWGLAFFREVGRQVDKPFDKIHPALRGRFEAYGLKAADWDVIRKAQKHQGSSGLTLLRPREVAELNPEIASRYLGMVQMDAEYAVPSGGFRSRSYLAGTTRPGTWQGEMVRSFLQFKSFGGVYAMIHGQRVVRELMAGNKWTAAGYGGAMLLASTFTGALASQLKQVAAGKDPRPMTDHKFWLSAMMQGGGIGLYGDFMFAEVNRYGGGLPNAIAGPAVEHVNDFWNLTAGNLIQLASQEETNFGRELVQFARGNTPGGTVWYLRGAWERMVLDQVQWLTDPAAAKSFRRKQQDLARSYGQGYWWKPGQATPSRAPDAGNVARPPGEDSFKAASGL